jgi:hypothetical protein
MKQEQERKPGVERRHFLRGLGIAAGGAVVAPAAAGAAEVPEPPQEQVKKRYQETEHVKRFYALNRL